MSRLPGIALLLFAILPSSASPQARYLALGDSITEGLGDDSSRSELGYPPRLEQLLIARGVAAEVVNFGIAGDTTATALSRLDEVLETGGDVLLVMEGTNDIGSRVSLETIVANLQEIGRRARSASFEVAYASVIPRGSKAGVDPDNETTEELAWELRDTAWKEETKLSDPFEVFIQTEDLFTTFYSDTYHPNADGYDLLAETFADALTTPDQVPPVAAFISPRDGATGVSPSAQLRFTLYDFGSGIDVAATSMQVDGAPVAATTSGNSRKLTLTYQPPSPLANVIDLGVDTRDSAAPANRLDRTLSHFTVTGTVFLTGDVDQDGRVDGEDLLALAYRFGSRRGESRYWSGVDFDSDGRIDGDDLAALAANFGQSSF